MAIPPLLGGGINRTSNPRPRPRNVPRNGFVVRTV